MTNRTYVLRLTEADRRVLLHAVSEHTIGNANDLSEMKACGWSIKDAKRLLDIESRIIHANIAG